MGVDDELSEQSDTGVSFLTQHQNSAYTRVIVTIEDLRLTFVRRIAFSKS